MTSWKNKLLIIGFYVSVLYSPVTGQNEGLYIYPKDETFYVGSDVTVKCKLGNETHNELVATNWTDWYTDSVLTAEEEYMETNVKKGYHLIRCQYNNLRNRTTLIVIEPDIRPVVNCTSLSELTCQCKWNIVNGVNYTYEIRTQGTIPWTLRIPQTHSGIASTSVIKAELYQDNLQDIRVNATKDISSASWITTHDIMRKLKPNITYKESTMTATSATIKWSGNSKPEYWKFQSQFKYKECDGETNETFRMLPDEIDEYSLITKTIDDLKPYIFYKFGIRSRYTRPGNGYTGWTYVVLRTNESRPSKEVQFEIESQEDDTLLKWNAVPKESQNGKILGYTIYVNSESYDVDVNNTEYSLKGIGGGNYNVCITASNSAGESPINCQPVNLTTQMELSSTKPHEETTSQDPPLNNSRDMSIVFGIIGILGVAVVLLYCGYSKLKKIEIFMTFPEPKFPKINFHNVNSLVRESETFDELCVRKTAVTISKRTCSTDIDINKLTPEIFRDGCHSYLKNLETESTTEITVHFPEDKDELLDGPVVYRILSKKKSDVPPVENENLISESNVNCIGLGAVMCIESPDSSKIIRDKTAVPIKKNGYCSMPPDRSSGQKVMTPCSDGGTFVYPDREYIVRCLDHGDIVPRLENVAQVSDHTSTVPYLKHGSTAPSLDDGYVASSSNHLGIDSPLKQDTTPSSSDHTCMAPLSELNVDSCSDYLCITTKPIKLPVTRQKENNNNDYVTMTHHIKCN